MIYHIIESYLTILVSVGLGAILIFVLGLYLIFKSPRKKEVKKAKPMPVELPIEVEKSHFEPTTLTKTSKTLTITSNDISAIAGDDVLMTQLDLARAYIETGRKQLAKKILEHVAEQGSNVQQDEARKLLGLT